MMVAHMSKHAIPICLAVADIAAAIVCLTRGDVARAVYWASASSITLTTVVMKS